MAVLVSDSDEVWREYKRVERFLIQLRLKIQKNLQYIWSFYAN